ncbi:MAG: 50S ribosomal protein L30 [Actinomyces ruminicola]|uniref:Large ribosomal subunit protein uL30 n=1 Tax=Actinomyces ruminicola TaxID=332524 RepID=A0A1H0A741_9ACTO|nr:50S ribosomal protein L30 [Actinomyces ruminicola]MBE6483100.1 50S ribosomal protein L30 [Actinomyces ruminicola]SDM43457.1 large subunit ribosomal protein L30 [Actinomyces ruminicola]SDN28813.1 LSU ribosomal protein L30P [Actinomyces ruminicola]
MADAATDKTQQDAGQIKVTQVRSGIGGTRRQRETLKALGLRRIRQSVVREDNPSVRGMIAKVAHLVTVEEA